jgi:hypothetical protein
VAGKREKSYNLEFRYEPDYFYVRVTGIRSKENMFLITQEYIEACLKRGYKKVLLDARELIVRLSVSEIYGTGRDLADKFRSYPWLKIAVIGLDENRGNFKFFEDVLNEFFKATKPQPDRGIDGIMQDGTPIQSKAYIIKYDKLSQFINDAKYHPLVPKPIKKVVAVSQSGFDESARKRQFEIETAEHIEVV